MELKGKIAIVTGASKGIGEEVALSLLDKGVWVYGWSRSEPEINHTNFIYQKVNMANVAEVNQAFETIGKPVDILINNAGLGTFANVEDTTDEEWHQMFDVNVHGLFYATRCVLPGMKKQESGHIINISSIAGLNGLTQAGAYCATKHAVRGFSHSLYLEVKKLGIKVSCIYPGSVHTEFFDKLKTIKANDTMLHADDIAASIIHLLETPDNYNISDLEVRPMNPVYQ